MKMVDMNWDKNKPPGQRLSGAMPEPEEARINELLALAWESGKNAARMAVSLVPSNHNEIRAQAIHDCYQSVRGTTNPYKGR